MHKANSASDESDDDENEMVYIGEGELEMTVKELRGAAIPPAMSAANLTHVVGDRSANRLHDVFAVSHDDELAEGQQSEDEDGDTAESWVRHHMD